MIVRIADDLDDDLDTEVAVLVAEAEAYLASWAEFERLYGADASGV